MLALMKRKVVQSVLKMLPSRVRLFVQLASAGALEHLSSADLTDASTWLKVWRQSKMYWHFTKLAPEMVQAVSLMKQNPEKARQAIFWMKNNGHR